jgi:hypothetical protein
MLQEFWFFITDQVELPVLLEEEDLETKAFTES